MLVLQILFSFWSSASCVTSLESSYFLPELLRTTAFETLYTVETAKSLLENKLIETDRKGRVEYTILMNLVGDILALQIDLTSQINPGAIAELAKLIEVLDPEKGAFSTFQLEHCYQERDAEMNLDIYKNCIRKLDANLLKPDVYALLTSSEWQKLVTVFETVERERPERLDSLNFNTRILLQLTTQALKEIFQISEDTDFKSAIADFLHQKNMGIAKNFNRLEKEQTDIRRVLIEGLFHRNGNFDAKTLYLHLEKTKALIRDRIIPLMDSMTPIIDDIPYPSLQTPLPLTQTPSAPLDK